MFMNTANKFKHPIDAHQRDWIVPIAQHEVGHYVSARVLGFRTGPISLTVFDFNRAHHATAEITLFCALRDLQSIEDYLERRIIVLYSGALAESLSNGQVDNAIATESLTKGGAKSDFDKVRELIQTLRNIRFPDATIEEEVQANLDALANQLWNKAGEIVTADSAIIEGLGRRLAGDLTHTNEKVTLSHDELEGLPVIRDRFGGPASDAPRS
jgi:hypothetical protein